MSGPGAAPAWRAVSASRRGSSHASGVPNQDAVRCERLSREGGADVWVAAVADGHGGHRYVRSDVGARTAVDVAVERVCEALTAGPDDDPAVLLRGEVPDIVEDWRERVRAHADAHPFTPQERGRGAVPLGSATLTAYGATLLVAIVGEEGVAVAQVGDGDALVRSHGFATRPVPGDPRLVAGETTSLCLDSAVDDFRFASMPATAETDLVLLATDGYGNSFAQPDWWHALVGDVASYVDRHGLRRLGEQLPDWLEESARVGGDDVSAVLVVREPLAVEAHPAADAVAVGAAADSVPRTLDLPPDHDDRPVPERDSAPRGRRRQRSVVPVLAALLTALVLGVGALLLLGPDVMGPSPVTPSDPSSTTPPADEGTDGDDRGGGRDERRDQQPGGRESSSPPSGPEQREDGEPPAEGEDGIGADGPRKPLPPGD